MKNILDDVTLKRGMLEYSNQKTATINRFQSAFINFVSCANVQLMIIIQKLQFLINTSSDNL